MPFLICNQKLATKTTQTFESKTASDEMASTHMQLESKIDTITQDTSKPYFRNVLKKLAIANPHNAIIICDYINAEITELNIKPSTIEGKIKVLVWLSNYHNGKPFNEMEKSDILVQSNP
jgi:hypothetical protein